MYSVEELINELMNYLFKEWTSWIRDEAEKFA